jgi:hypothetical protein
LFVTAVNRFVAALKAFSLCGVSDERLMRDYTRVVCPVQQQNASQWKEDFKRVALRDINKSRG